MKTQIKDPKGGPKARIALAELEHLPPTLRPEEAFALLGVGRTTGYELIRKEELPALRLGGKLLVPTASRSVSSVGTAPRARPSSRQRPKEPSEDGKA